MNLTLFPLAYGPYGTVLKKKIDFKIRRDHQKISYEHRDYESVD